ncbi:MAG: DUF3592 domain-containing protein, partial [Bacteroidales bacterium]|nr:DUF3592 domain-containing protein [Bacteroidales bacterium]
MRIGIGTRTTRKPGNANPVTLGIIFALVGGAIFFVFALPPLQYASSSKSWPTVQGVITRSDIDVWTRDGKTHYQPDIAYTYSVDGKKYSSSKINAGEQAMDNNVNSAKKIQTKYPAGKEVTIWYDPGLPASSALEPGIKTGDILLASIAAIFFLVGIFSFYKGLKAKKVI